MADADFGEMFHNFPMPERLRKYSGVEVGPVLPFMQTHLKGHRPGHCLLRWSRQIMGMRPSPYLAVRYYFWGDEFIRGDPSSTSNYMRYNRVRMNLHGGL